MSLLMDALRKAEDAKRQAGSSAAPELTLAPLSPRQPAGASPLPDLAEHSAAIDAGLSALASEAQPRRTGSTPAPANAAEREAAARSAARNLFATKARPSPLRTPWTIVAVATLVAVLAIGAYFWWQLNALSPTPRPQLAAPASQPAAPALPPPPAPLSGAAAVAAAAAVSATSSVEPAAMSPTAPVDATSSAKPAATTAATPLADATPAARQRSPRATPEAAPNAVPKATAAGNATATDNALRLRKSPAATGDALERAYDDLQAGRIDDAQRAYEQVLRGDPHSTDALLGLATIATRQGRADAAQTYYLRALESDPGDATAQAGLINGRGQSDPAAAESRLKSALSAQPESSPLLFALGNLYARQTRWSEAQQAYFRAYAAEPDNADIIFNLAVALDHLRQGKLAAQYYQMALAAARDSQRGVLFDRQQVSSRIQELQP